MLSEILQIVVSALAGFMFLYIRNLNAKVDELRTIIKYLKNHNKTQNESQAKLQKEVQELNATVSRLSSKVGLTNK